MLSSWPESSFMIVVASYSYVNRVWLRRIAPIVAFIIIGMSTCARRVVHEAKIEFGALFGLLGINLWLPWIIPVHPHDHNCNSRFGRCNWHLQRSRSILLLCVSLRLDFSGGSSTSQCFERCWFCWIGTGQEWHYLMPKSTTNLQLSNTINHTRWWYYVTSQYKLM